MSKLIKLTEYFNDDPVITAGQAFIIDGVKHELVILHEKRMYALMECDTNHVFGSLGIPINKCRLSDIKCAVSPNVEMLNKNRIESLISGSIFYNKKSGQCYIITYDVPHSTYHAVDFNTGCIIYSVESKVGLNECKCRELFGNKYDQMYLLKDKNAFNEYIENFGWE